MTSQTRSAAYRYSMAFVFVVSGLLLRLWLQDYLGSYLPSTLLMLGVVLAAWFGGVGPGLVASVLAAVLLDYYFLEPRYTFGISNRAELTAFLVALTAGVIVSIFAANPQGLRSRCHAILKWSWIYFLFLSGFLKHARNSIARTGGIVVLTFHRVLPKSQYATTNSLPGMVVQEPTFEALARYISQHYPTVPLEGQAVSSADEKRPRLAVTFDDGWIDNAIFAAPVVRRYDLPTTIFICSAKVGSQLPFWPERLNTFLRALRAREASVRKLEASLASYGEHIPRHGGTSTRHELLEPLVQLLKHEEFPEESAIVRRIISAANLEAAEDDHRAADATMSWNDIRWLHEQGVNFGSHSKSHQILSRISLPEVLREVAEGREEIEQKLGADCLLFSYPNGDWSPEVRNAVAQAGYRYAFTNEEGVWTTAGDPLLIPRVNIWEGKLVGPSGRFSPVAFEYATFWKAYRRKQEVRSQQAEVRMKTGRDGSTRENTSGALFST